MDKTSFRAPRPKLHDWANVLVGRDAWLYQTFVDKAQSGKADPREWKWDPDGKGIWVCQTWFDDPAARAKQI